MPGGRMRSDYVEDYDWEPPEGRVVGKSDDLDEWNTKDDFDDDDSYDEGFGPSRRGPRRRKRQQPFRAQRRPRRGGGRSQGASRRAASSKINLGGLSGSRREKLEKRRRQLELELSAINSELTGSGRKSASGAGARKGGAGNGFGKDSSLFRSNGGNDRRGRQTNQNAEFSSRNDLTKEQLDKELDELRFSGAGGDEQRKVEAATTLDDDLDAYFASAPSQGAPSTEAAPPAAAETTEPAAKEATTLPFEAEKPAADTSMETEEAAEETPADAPTENAAAEEGAEDPEQAAKPDAESPADTEMGETLDTDAPPEGTVEETTGQES